MAIYGSDAMRRMDCEDETPRRKVLMQTASRFVLLGNPFMGTVDGKGLTPSIVPARTVGGREAIFQGNPGVSSGGGSSPYQSQFVNGGVDDSSNGGYVNPNGTMDPVTAINNAYNNVPALSDCQSCSFGSGSNGAGVSGGVNNGISGTNVITTPTTNSGGTSVPSPTDTAMGDQAGGGSGVPVLTIVPPSDGPYHAIDTPVIRQIQGAGGSSDNPGLAIQYAYGNPGVIMP